MLNMLRIRCSALTCVIVGLICAPGCGKKGPSLAPVVGTIRYEGKPVGGASVSFVPSDPKLRAATAITDDQGNYRLETLGFGEGAIVGKHRVSVALRTPTPPVKDLKTPRQIGKPLLPAKYFNPDKSGLSAEVTATGENRFDFDLSGPIQ